MARKHIYTFGGGKTEGSTAMNQLLGGKGAGIAEKSHIRIPVPPGFTMVAQVSVASPAGAQGLPSEVGGDVRGPCSGAEPPVGERVPTATCRTSSSPSSAGGCSCCRPVPESGPASPRSAPPLVVRAPSVPPPRDAGAKGQRGEGRPRPWFRIAAAVTAILVLGVGTAAALFVVFQPARFPATVIACAAPVLFGNAVMMARAIRNLLQKNDAVLQEPARVYVVDALKRWEPRVRVTSVQVARERLDGENVLAIRLRYNIIWTNVPGNNVILAGVEQTVRV